MPIARPEIRAAQEPLTQEEFRRAIEQGLGRAILCLQKHNPEPYKEIILETCLKDTRYDSQCEGSRVPYLMQAIDLCDDQTFFRDVILEAYPETPVEVPENKDTWLEEQFTNFALAFAQRGDLKARKLLFESFAANPAYAYRFALNRDYAIIELDGLTGLTFVLEQYARIAQQDPEFSFRYWYMGGLFKQYGKAAIVAHIEKLCTENTAVQNLITRSELLVSEKTTPHKKPKRLPYKNLQDAVSRRSEYRGSIPFWSQRATKVQLRQAARDLLVQTDPELIRGYLYVFYKRVFPMSVKHLLALAYHENEEVREHTIIALQRFQSPRVRDLALGLLEDLKLRAEAIGLFEENYLAGDFQYILQVLRNLDDNHEIHQVGYCVRDVYKKNQLSEALEPLLLQYEQNPCSNCRESTLELLFEIGILPDWVLKEAQFDSDEGIREKAQAWAASQLEQK